MPTSRRVFLKSGAIAGASAALGAIPGMAAPAASPGTESLMDPAIEVVVGVAVPSAVMSEFNRGPGAYPGAPDQYFSPELVPDTTTYRNLALLRPAYHSSSYDYNLTAQLITDGIKHTQLPAWVSTIVSGHGVMPKNEREVLLDHSNSTSQALMGPRPTVQIQLGGGVSVPEVDRIDLVVVPPGGVSPADLTYTVSISDDGRDWKPAGSVTGPPPASVAGYPPDFAHAGELFTPSIRLTQPCRSRFYQVEYAIKSAERRNYRVEWKAGEIAFFNQGKRVQIGGPYSFTSAWMSAGLGEEWVYVDLGAPCHIDRVKLFWIAPAAEGVIQISDDAEKWHDLHALTAGGAMTQDAKLAVAVRTRYVRVLMLRPTSPDGYMLSELEVYGRGGFVAHARPAPAAAADGSLDLSGGAWRLQRLSLIDGDGAALSKPGFEDKDWIPATVPGTVLTSYLNVGAIPNPDYGRNQLYVSDSFFYSDFWYRTEFDAPALAAGQIAWLNFDGINWKAEIFLNGEKLGRIEGGFMRGRFDVSAKLRAGEKNALAVRIEKNATPASCKQKTYESPGNNGGALGADNPTYHASIGWDWIPTIRGRNTGLIESVSLKMSGAVTIEDPFVTTTLPLPDTSRADVSIAVDLVNHSSTPVAGTLRGDFGESHFEQKVTIPGAATKRVTVDPSTTASLRLQNPKLWWPVGYGDPYLYDVELDFIPDGGTISDTKKFKAGVRQMSYSEEGAALKIWINGRRLIAKGGNWGFPESMLRYRAREYDAAVRYHREMNFNMIRNWVGQIGDDAFYEACDRHGVMVWQDFWLANPWDGPDPDDDALFMSNVKDTVLRIRNRASIGIYCGRNEGSPPPPLESGIRKVLADFHPDIHYIPSSAEYVVGGGGPYMEMPLTFYPLMATYPKLHSEIGMPNIPSIESVRMMMPEHAMWPQALEWGLHDFCLAGAQGGTSFKTTIDEGYGGTDNIAEWISLAQFVQYDGFRAMFEAQSKNRMGLLLWMSHPCWPSFVWQTYDYYLEPTSAYFACKSACEPLHIQWNRLTNMVEVVNYSGGEARAIVATAEVLNMDGTSRWKNTMTLDAAEDSVSLPFEMHFPAGLTPVHFLRLTLMRGSELVSSNFYLRGSQEANYRAIRQLAKAHVTPVTTSRQAGKVWQLTTQLHNVSTYPALMVRLKAIREKTGDRILPAIYDDNYFALMPGEQRTIKTELNQADTRGETPKIVLSGFNVDSGPSLLAGHVTTSRLKSGNSPSPAPR
ncbi:MAG TPA: discoidin domain-containing protein [Acidisarcina sp.]